MQVIFEKKIFLPKFFPLLDDPHRFIVLRGGAGSGKSEFSFQKLLYKTLSKDQCTYLVLRKVARTIKNSTFSVLKRLVLKYDLSSLFKINNTDFSMTCKNGNKIIFSGLDDHEKMQSIDSVTDVFMEEASEYSFDDFKQINLRVRQRADDQITLSFNPISATHWSKSYFWDVPKKNATLHVSTYRDNPFIPQIYRDEIELLKISDPLWYDIYGNAEWGQCGGNVFHNFVIENFDLSFNDFDAFSIGVDFGYVHAFALVCVGLKDGEIYIFDEYYTRRQTDEEVLPCIEKYKDFDMIADSASPGSIRYFCNHGFSMMGVSKTTIEEGIRYLRQRKIHIHKTRCPNSAREFANFSYRKDKSGEDTEEFIKIDDDCIAATRYALSHYINSSDEKFNPQDFINIV